MSLVSKIILFSPARYTRVIRPISFTLRKFSKEVADDRDKPLSYLDSKAAKWPARYSRTQGSDERLSYEPFVISGCLTIFLIYFCILREENDIDLELTKTLYDRLPDTDKKEMQSLQRDILGKSEPN